MILNTDINKIPSPCFVVEEKLLRRNLALIKDVADRAGVEIIVALKANATWSIFPIMREYVDGATASSLSEAKLVFEKFGTKAHTYAPVYTDAEFDEICICSHTMTFNSLSQYERLGERAREARVSCGLRINPGWSPVETELYNPAQPGSRLGIPVEKLRSLPQGIEGLHCHNLCESEAADLEHTFEAIEANFGHLLPQIKWLNMGGGHLMTREGYDVEGLIGILINFKARHPHLHIILEPGSAFTWRTGVLVATIEDIVENGGVSTIMPNVSFACHMPDCLEMPYKPAVVGAHDPQPGEQRWRIGGNSCLAGDYIGDWSFDREPKVGDRLIFEDMIHYTMVKTTMFNGVTHPSIAILREDGTLDVVRQFGYEDYRDRMS